jgi:hypothetical protein
VSDGGIVTHIGVLDVLKNSDGEIIIVTPAGYDVDYEETSYWSKIPGMTRLDP